MQALLVLLLILTSFVSCKNPDPEMANQAPVKKTTNGPISSKPDSKKKFYFSKNFLNGVELKRSSVYLFQNIVCENDSAQCALSVKSTSGKDFVFYISNALALNLKNIKSNRTIAFHYFEDDNAPLDHRIKITQAEYKDQVIDSNLETKTIKPVIISKIVKNEKNYNFIIESNGNFKRTVELDEKIYQFLEDQDPYIFTKASFGIIYKNNSIIGLIYKNGRQVFIDPQAGEN